MGHCEDLYKWVEQQFGDFRSTTVQEKVMLQESKIINIEVYQFNAKDAILAANFLLTENIATYAHARWMEGAYTKVHTFVNDEAQKEKSSPWLFCLDDAWQQSQDWDKGRSTMIGDVMVINREDGSAIKWVVMPEGFAEMDPVEPVSRTACTRDKDRRFIVLAAKDQEQDEDQPNWKVITDRLDLLGLLSELPTVDDYPIVRVEYVVDTRNPGPQNPEVSNIVYDPWAGIATFNTEY
jgi:hypothetical protein